MNDRGNRRFGSLADARVGHAPGTEPAGGIRHACVLGKRAAVLICCLAALFLSGCGGGYGSSREMPEEPARGTEREMPEEPARGTEREMPEESARGAEREMPEEPAYGLAGRRSEEPAYGPAGRGLEETALGAAGERLKVVATIFPYYDFVRQIAGDLVDLELVIPAGMDSHSFEPTPAHMRTIQEADVLICNGGSMEYWVSQVLSAIDTSSMTVVTMMDYADVAEEEIVEGMEDEHGEHRRGAEDVHEGEDEQNGSGHGAKEYGQDESGHGEGEYGQDGSGHGAGEYDEHIWTSPPAAVTFSEVIADTLAEADPDHKDAYMAGRDAYVKELKKVHEDFLGMTARRRRDMIVVADKFPFRYLTEEYGLTYRAAFPGCSTDTEPAAKTIAYLIGQVREQQVPAVYYLELSSPRVAEIISEETGAEPLKLYSCHNVTRAELESGVTYTELMERNVENLSKGLTE